MPKCPTSARAWFCRTRVSSSRRKPWAFPPSLEVQAGGLPEALAEADVAIASTGTVTTECAYFGVPTVALYKTSWSTWQIARRIVKVKYMAMPNLLANEEVFPEFIQGAATPDNITRATVELCAMPPGAPKSGQASRNRRLIG